MRQSLAWGYHKSRNDQDYFVLGEELETRLRDRGCVAKCGC